MKYFKIKAIKVSCPNMFKIFKAPSKVVAQIAVSDMRKLTGASEYHITYSWNIDNDDDVEVHIGADTERDLDARIAVCKNTLDHYGIK